MSDQWTVLTLSVLTSSIVFTRRALVLNRCTSMFSPLRFLTWCVSILSGLLFWTTLNTLRSNILLQLFVGVLSSALSWLVYVLLYNEDFAYPTRQQWFSLVFHVLTEALILIQVRLIIV